jgi:phage terminase large subunit
VEKETIEITLQPKQKEAMALCQTTPVLFFGGAKGGGKSYFVRARQVSRRLRYPNTHGIIIRKTHPELLANHINKMWQEYPSLKQYYNKAEKIIYFPNGSTLTFSYLQNPDDVYTYQGREYEDIDVDEITQHQEIVFKTLRSSNRTSNQDFYRAGGMPTMTLTGNPGGVGHQWVKRIFIDRMFKEEEDPEDFKFLPAFVQDNVALTRADPRYIKNLQGLPLHLRKAYLEGDWNIHAGQAFSELSIHKHVVNPFELPAETRYFAGYDHGFNHPFAFVLFAVVPDGTVYVVKRIRDRLKRPDEIAQMIKEQCEDIIKAKKRIEIFAGADLWSKQRDGTPSVYEQFLDAGLKPGMGYVILRAKIDRVQGVGEIRKWIAWRNRIPEEPRLYFFENCKDVFNSIAEMQFDDTKPEDVMKIDADENGEGGDDLYDGFRYGIMSRMFPSKIDKPEYSKDSAMAIMQEHLNRKDLERRIGAF